MTPEDQARVDAYLASLDSTKERRRLEAEKEEAARAVHESYANDDQFGIF